MNYQEAHARRRPADRPLPEAPPQRSAARTAGPATAAPAPSRAGAAHRVLDALADPTRREVLAALRGGPASVGELADRLPVSRPAVSQHLRVLRESGLVSFEAAGTRNVYRLHPAGLRPLRAWLDELWSTALGDFAAYAAARATEGTTP